MRVWIADSQIFCNLRTGNGHSLPTAPEALLWGTALADAAQNAALALGARLGFAPKQILEAIKNQLLLELEVPLDDVARGNT